MNGQEVLKSRTRPQKISWLEEPVRYGEAFRNYWPLIISIGLFFGWLLSFPLQGPLFMKLTQVENLDPLSLETLFLLGHIIGLVIAGIAGYFFRRCLKWFSWAGIPCFLLSISITLTPGGAWGGIFAFLGFFAGFAIISWGSYFASGVLSYQRGRTFVLGAAIANLVLYLVNNLSGLTDIRPLVEILSLLSLALPVFLAAWRRKNPLNQILPDKGTQKAANPTSPWPFLPFIFIIYAVGGMMYSVVGNVSSNPSGLLNFYTFIPYVVLLFLAGAISDTFGRRFNSILGAIAVGVGFMLAGLLSGNMQFVMVQTFMVGGYAFLDTFTWVIAADLSISRRTPIYYSAVLGTNILAILTGVVLGGKFSELVSGDELLIVCIAGILCFISLALVYKLRETLKFEECIPAPKSQASLEILSQKMSFTPRELEIVKLLIEGASTTEILGQLVITPNTLKTHLRNIYRKSGARNRWEFTMVIMKETNGSDEARTGAPAESEIQTD
jgi:DNA-binding CsgD family transcriptional regulator